MAFANLLLLVFLKMVVATVFQYVNFAGRGGEGLWVTVSVILYKESAFENHCILFSRKVRFMQHKHRTPAQLMHDNLHTHIR